MHVHNYDPTQGQAFQGDVSIIPIPSDIAIATTDEIKPIDNKLILQEGELTGHHHHIVLPSRNFRPAAATVGDGILNVRDTTLRKKFFGGGKVKMKDLTDAIAHTPTAHLYRDPAAVQTLATKPYKAPNGEMIPILTRTDLAVGCLVIEGDGMPVKHQEHDAITIPPGNYLIGRQIESAGAEERVVAD